MLKSEPELIIVGAGIIGCNLAFRAAEAGLRVHVFDRCPDVGQEATEASVGILSYAPSRPKPAVWHHLASGAIAAHTRLANDLKFQGGDLPVWRWLGRLNVADNAEAETRLREQLRVDRAQNHSGAWYSKKAIHTLEPGLGSKICGGVLNSQDGEVNPLVLACALRQAALSHGAVFHFETEVKHLIIKNNTVQGLETADKSYMAERVVIAAGAWARQLDPDQNLPVEPIRGQALHVVTPGSQLIKHIIFGKGIYLVPKDDGITIGASHEHVGFQKGNTIQEITKLLSRAMEIIPALGAVDWTRIKVWSGLRPGSPEGTPFIGADPKYDGLWWAAGHHVNGILLAPITAEKLTEDLINNTQDIVMARP